MSDDGADPEEGADSGPLVDSAGFVDPEDLVGTSAEGTFDVERWLAHCWARATRNDDPAYLRPDDGVQFVPPTATQVVAREATGLDVEGRLRDDDWSDDRVFLGGQGFSFDRPLHVGETYRVRGEIDDVRHERGSSGPLSIVRVAYDAWSADGTPAFETWTDLVVRRPELEETAFDLDETASDDERTIESDGASSASETAGAGGADGDRERGSHDSGPVVATTTVEDVGPAAMRLVAAIVRDSNLIHYDRAYAAALGHDGRVNQGPINASYAAQAAREVAGGSAAVRRLEVRFEAFVCEGETVTATARRTAAGRDRTGGDAITPLELELEKADGTVALTGTADVRTDPNAPWPAADGS